MEWPKRARTADWENGVLTLDREKKFETPELTAEIMERLARYTLVGFHGALLCSVTFLILLSITGFNVNEPHIHGADFALCIIA